MNNSFSVMLLLDWMSFVELPNTFSIRLAIDCVLLLFKTEGVIAFLISTSSSFNISKGHAFTTFGQILSEYISILSDTLLVLSTPPAKNVSNLFPYFTMFSTSFTPCGLFKMSFKKMNARFIIFSDLSIFSYFSILIKFYI